MAPSLVRIMAAGVSGRTEASDVDQGGAEQRGCERSVQYERDIEVERQRCMEGTEARSANRAQQVRNRGAYEE